MNSVEVKAAWTLASLFAFRMLGLFMILPIFAVYGQELEYATPALIGLALGGYGLTQALFQVPFGYLSDRIGRKPVIIMGLALFLLGSLVAAYSETIYGVIIGRLLQGAGAIAAAVMALLSDLTRDENRTKAMAMVGASIGLSFSIALIVGPFVAGLYELKGVFLLTAILAGCGIALTLWVVPRSASQTLPVSRDVVAVPSDFAKVLQNNSLLRLDFGIFLLHMTMTAGFVVLPLWLVKFADLNVSEHWRVYLPVLFLSFVGMVPIMILGEKASKTKFIFLLAIMALFCGLLALGRWHESLLSIVTGLFVFFLGFNLLEAMLPSLVSKFAEPGLKGTSMGVYSTCQFLGAFVGGAGGGWLLAGYGADTVFYFASIGIAVWWLWALSMKQPAKWQNVTLQLSDPTALAPADWVAHFQAVAGVKEAVVLPEGSTVYLKVDSKGVDQEQLQRLSSASALRAAE